MKIGFLTPEYPHLETTKSAGIGSSIKNLAKALSSSGVEVFLFVFDQNKTTYIKEEGIHIYLIEKKSYLTMGWYLNRKRIQNYISQIINTEEINLIESIDWTGITAFMSFRIPLIIRLHGSDAYFCKLEKRKQKWKNYFFEKIALKKADAFISPTNFAGEIAIKIFNLKQDRIRTIHYGLDLEKFKNHNPTDYQSNTVLYVGTIIRKKGVFELMKIFDSLLMTNPEAELILVGNDAPDILTGSKSTWEMLQNQMSHKVKSRIRFLGSIPYGEIDELISKSQICVFPSFAETLGMVTIEAMALNKPVVNSNIGWANEIIEDGVSGFLVHPKNHTEYANKISLLLSDKNLCAKIGLSARKQIERKFDIAKIAHQNIQFYSQFI